MTFYGLKNCDTCKKALKALNASGISPDIVDVRQDGVPDERLAAWLVAHGPEKVINRRSTTWRNLGETDRARAADNAGAQALLAENPTLVKRPVIELDGAIHIGWDAAVQRAVLGSGG